jgi:predicted  nucleic acid-binding Zn-ribbon protein
MLRSDSTALFERLRDANSLLQEVLSGAQNNMGAIEQLLSSRVTEFVSTMNSLLERTGATTTHMDEHISSFYGLTTKVLGDLGDLAGRFDTHGRALVEAVELLDKSNHRTREVITERLDELDGLMTGLDTRTEDLDQRLKRFSALLDESLAASETRARDIARIVAESTAETARAIADQHDSVRLTSEQERQRTTEALHAAYEQASSDSQAMFRQTAAESEKMLQDAQELDATRHELRRGILELPQETAESAAQMRRVIVDQIEALAELNRIVARHGRSIDTAAAEPARSSTRREDAVVVSMNARSEARTMARGDITGMPTQMPPLPSRRADSPSLSPSQPPAAARSGWLTDLLSRASRDEDAPRGDERRQRPDDRGSRSEERPARHTIESLDSLSVDIARMIDHDAAAELWDRYNRGERNVFTRQLYTMQGQKTFDDIRKRYRADREFKQTVDRYIGEFERLLEEVSRDDRGQMMARTYLTSETGKVYTMLAHAAGRFD